MPVTEMPLAFLENTDEAPGRQGIVDVYVARQGYKTDLVVEIDRTNKGWSALKLGHAVTNGRSAIWIRWSGREPLTGWVPEGVEVIYVSADRRPRVEPADRKDTRPVDAASRLSGASRALLAAAFPAGPPPDDPGWSDEGTIWSSYVATLGPRMELVIRCRFGHYAAKPFTLSRTSEVVADELGVDVVTRERIRQLEKQALRRIRRASQARARRAQMLAGTEATRSPSLVEPAANAAAEADLGLVGQMVLEIAAASGADGIRASLVGHVLRGSDGPVTRELVRRLRLPHDGVLKGVPYRSVYETVLNAAATPPLRLRNGRIFLTDPA